MQRASTQFDSILHERPGLMLGRFDCALGHPSFADTGPIENHVVVVPERPIEIHCDGTVVVADPTRAMLYNRGCEYTRRALNPTGDTAWWIALDDARLADALGSHPDRPYRRRWSALPAGAYLQARALFRALAGAGGADPLMVEETAWMLVDRCAGREDPSGGNVTPRQRRTVARAEALIAERFRERLSLDGIADAVFSSPYHLCRIFKRLTGSSVHQRIAQLRLRTAVPILLAGGGSLTEVATELGFASSSHFSTAFRQGFGFAPSQVVRAVADGRLAFAGRASLNGVRRGN